MLDWTLSVTELNEYVRKLLAANPMLRGVKLRGEISGLKRHTSGHLYFTLKDEGARIDAVMFRQQAMMLDFKPRDGMQVIAEGSVSLFAAAGRYQFYAENMRPEGQGDLYLRFEKLKSELREQGLFDESLKKPLPMRAQRVGIITSPTGAVVHDIQTVAQRRDPSVELTLCPVNVQGGAAAREIARAIARMDKLGFDLLIVGRGGGSLEDLWAFNEEIVARAIYNCNTPVISAVGHEVDFTIADFVADVRAATPSVAAELAIADREELRRMIDDRSRRLARAASAELTLMRAYVERMDAKLEMHSPARQVELARTRRDSLERRLTAAKDAYLTAKRAKLQQTCSALAAAGPHTRVKLMQQNAAQTEKRLTRALRSGLDSRRRTVENLEKRLNALSSESVLRRGYAVVSVKGRAVSGVKELQPGDMLDVRFADGRADALTVDINEKRAEE